MPCGLEQIVITLVIAIAIAAGATQAKPSVPSQTPSVITTESTESVTPVATSSGLPDTPTQTTSIDSSSTRPQVTGKSSTASLSMSLTDVDASVTASADERSVTVHASATVTCTGEASLEREMMPSLAYDDGSTRREVLASTDGPGAVAPGQSAKLSWTAQVPVTSATIGVTCPSGVACAGASGLETLVETEYARVTDAIAAKERERKAAQEKEEQERKAREEAERAAEEERARQESERREAERKAEQERLQQEREENERRERELADAIRDTSNQTVASGGERIRSTEDIDKWAARIDAYLSGHELAGYGKQFAEAAARHGLAPRLSAAISFIESGGGDVCFRPHNAWGWGSSSWDSWEEAIEAHAAGLEEGYGPDFNLELCAKYSGSDGSYYWEVLQGELAKM